MNDYIPDWYKAQCKRVVKFIERKGLVRLLGRPAGCTYSELRDAAQKCRELGLLTDGKTEPKIDKRKKEWIHEHQS